MYSDDYTSREEKKVQKREEEKLTCEGTEDCSPCNRLMECYTCLPCGELLLYHLAPEDERYGSSSVEEQLFCIDKCLTGDYDKLSYNCYNKFIKFVFLISQLKNYRRKRKRLTK